MIDSWVTLIATATPITLGVLKYRSLAKAQLSGIQAAHSALCSRLDEETRARKLFAETFKHQVGSLGLALSRTTGKTKEVDERVKKLNTLVETMASFLTGGSEQSELVQLGKDTYLLRRRKKI